MDGARLDEVTGRPYSGATQMAVFTRRARALARAHSGLDGFVRCRRAAGAAPRGAVR